MIDPIIEAMPAINTFVREAIRSAIRRSPLELHVSIPLSHKCISEIGGRIIEEYLVQAIEAFQDPSETFYLRAVAARAMGDFEIRSTLDDTLVLLVDIKAGHRSIRDKTAAQYAEKGIALRRPGASHPNLASVKKLEDLYGDDSRKNTDLAILIVGYDPFVVGSTIRFRIEEPGASPLRLIREFSESNLSLGQQLGQIQLSRGDRVETELRSKTEFLELIGRVQARPRQKRRSRIL